MKEFFGTGQIKKLKQILEDNKVKNIFLVRGKNSFESCGAKERLDLMFEGYNIVPFFDFDTNPKLEDVAKGIKLFKESNCEVIIAMGGGSVIDMGKLINIFSMQKEKPIQYIRKEKNTVSKGKLFIAIPTTSGSGSEATHFAVVYVDKKKFSVEDQKVLPDYSIIDPEFTNNLPKGITASTGMDALGHAVEAYWSVNSTEESKSYSEEAIKLIIEHLPNAVHNPTKESRIALSKAAHLAGKAINIAKTTASHAISYPLTSYFNVPHGHSVGLTIGKVLVYNSKVNKDTLLDKRGVEYVKNTISELCKILNVNNPESAEKKIKDLMKRAGLKTSLNELGLKREDIALIIRNVNIERLANNPKKFTENELKEILSSLI